MPPNLLLSGEELLRELGVASLIALGTFGVVRGVHWLIHRRRASRFAVAHEAWCLALMGFGAAGMAMRSVSERAGRLDALMGQVYTAAFYIGLIWFSLALVSRAIETVALRAADQRRSERLLVPISRNLLRGLGYVLTLIAGMAAFGFQVGPILASLGLGGIVVALAAKDSVENIFGSITILFDMPFAIGDWVRIDKVEGVVEEINLRSTRIRTFDDTLITVPNANLIRAAVENFGARRNRRQRFYPRLQVTTSAACIQSFCQVLRQKLNAIPNLDTARTLVNPNEFTDTGILVQVVAYLTVDTFAQEVEGRERIITAILHAAEEAQVQLTETGTLRSPVP